VFFVVSVAAAQPAFGHRGTGGKGYVSTFSAVVPNVLGLNVNVLGGDDRPRVSNYSGKTLVILGYEREPYLRFAKDGVWVNVHSPAAHLNRFRYPPALEPGLADAAAQPAWRRVRAGVTFEWHDHRIYWTSKDPPEAVNRHPERTHLIFHWRVPGRADGKRFAITGFLGYVPQGGRTKREGDWVVPVAAAAIGSTALVALAAGTGARRRRRRAP